MLVKPLRGYVWNNFVIKKVLIRIMMLKKIKRKI